jgi:RNA polymerase sigma-70 factor (ECF subfamily)
MADDDLTALYRTYGPAIYARCRRLLGDDADAEDATQETFVRVHKHLARLPPGREALFWIHRVATNHCLNQLRDRRSRRDPAPVLSQSARATAISDGAEQRLCDRDLATQLIDEAQTKLRAVAWLYHVDGFEQEEVAQILGLSRRTVATRLDSFLKNARKFIKRSGS